MENDVTKLARLYAKLYIHLAKAVTERFGEEGREAVRLGTRNFAVERGKDIRERVLAKGEELTMENFYANHDSSLGEAGFQMDMELGKWSADGVVKRCPFAEIWKEYGAAELGRIYCEVDEGMLEGYNPDLKLERPELIIEGADRCVFHWSERGDD